MRVSLLVFAWLMAAAAPAGAQRLPVASRGFGVAVAVATERLQPVAAPVPATHWKRDAMIGGLGTGAALVGLLYFHGCTGSCFVDAVAFSPIVMIPGAFIGAMIGGLFPKPSIANALVLPDSQQAPNFPVSSFRRAEPWKGAVLLGVLSGTIFVVMVATQAGDEGSDRKFSNRLSDGLVAGAMLAVPVTVIFAMVAGEGS